MIDPSRKKLSTVQRPGTDLSLSPVGGTAARRRLPGDTLLLFALASTRRPTSRWVSQIVQDDDHRREA
jgi:hypothetical protein